MNIYAKNGDKVKCYTLKAGYEYHQEIAKKHLIEGRVYTVDSTVVDSYHTDVYLQEFPNIAFNSVFFEDVPSEKKRTS